MYAHLTLAEKVAGQFQVFPAVEAIALAGSQTSGAGDRASDIDLYVYTTVQIPVADRAAIIDRLKASRADLNLQFWDPGDEWFDAATGIEVDVMYWDIRWIEETLDRVILRNEASLGYTTCHWNTIQKSQSLFDRRGWFHGLQAKSRQAYPEALRQAIITKNHPVLRSVIPAYLHQIEKAVRRNDLFSLNHRVAALLASYFDILFAVNRALHPGEKRLVEAASECCTSLPAGMADQVGRVLRATCSADTVLITQINQLLDNLDRWLVEAGFDFENTWSAGGIKSH